MKKIITIVLMLNMMISTACAECSVFMPQSVSVTIEQTTCKSMFVIDSNHELSGIKNLREANSHLVFNSFEYGTNIRGILDDGTVLRSRGLARLAQVDGYWFGLTPFDVEVELFDEYKGLVQSIVTKRVAAETLTNPAIIASTLWLDGTYAGHIFYSNSTRRVQVGRVVFINQDCYINLWAGDIDGNDELELGFIPGTWYAPEPTPDKEKDSTITITTTCTGNKTTEKSNCSTTVVNKGNGNNITTTSTKVNGNNNVTTTTNNTTNTITLFGVTINKNTNTTTTTTTNKTVRRPLGVMRDSIKSPGRCG